MYVSFWRENSLTANRTIQQANGERRNLNTQFLHTLCETANKSEPNRTTVSHNWEQHQNGTVFLMLNVAKKF